MTVSRKDFKPDTKFKTYYLCGKNGYKKLQGKRINPLQVRFENGCVSANIYNVKTTKREAEARVAEICKRSQQRRQKRLDAEKKAEKNLTLESALNLALSATDIELCNSYFSCSCQTFYQKFGGSSFENRQILKRVKAVINAKRKVLGLKPLAAYEIKGQCKNRTFEEFLNSTDRAIARKISELPE